MVAEGVDSGAGVAEGMTEAVTEGVAAGLMGMESKAPEFTTVSKMFFQGEFASAGAGQSMAKTIARAQMRFSFMYGTSVCFCIL
jgi:hypothetical protein